MTQPEAECFLALKRWQRECLRLRLNDSLKPPFFMGRLFARGKLIGKLFIVVLNIALLPLLILWWCLSILKAIFFIQPSIWLTYAKPRNIRGPGERNIKGIHYQFASHIELPIEMYIACVNEWTALLYGSDKLPKYRLENYLDNDYLERRKVAHNADPLIEQMLKTQISNAREELSRDLGHY